MSTSASDPWWELTLAVPDALVDDAGAAFVSEGALGCEHQSAGSPLPTFAGDQAPPPPPAPGTTRLVASFDGALDQAEVESLAADAMLGLGLEPGGWSLTRRTDVDWAERWKEHFKPLPIGPRVWIVPSWEYDFRAPSGAVVITLDPGMAFGTGQHATTALCLELLEAGLTEPGSRRLLDVGCGSGILAIAAARLGCDEVLAIDNDPVAVSVAHENVAQNGVGEVVRASADDVAAVAQSFDWVVANIIAHTLIELARPLVERTRPGGSLVLSGVLTGQADEVIAAMGSAARELGRSPPVVVDRRNRDEWIAVRLRI
jgi:ribosomal protein L11 methyltransferase